MHVKQSTLLTTPVVRLRCRLEPMTRHRLTHELTARTMSLQVQLRAPGVPVAAPRRAGARRPVPSVVASASREHAAHPVVVGSLAALMAGAPLLDASAAFAAVRDTQTAADQHTQAGVAW